uniref:SUN domain-containing protein 1-like n=1 Tax=Centroberyx gerrardi TaxID=166262 RepID=UPI003AACB371
MEDFSELHLNASLRPVNTGYTYSTSSSYSSAVLDSEKEQQIVPSLLSPIMSRRSLRLHPAAPFGDDGLLDRSLPCSSASFSAGGAAHRNARSLTSRRSQQHSVSCSQSLLLQTPRRPAGPSLHNSSLHSVASDASLLSSMLDESTIQERTLVDGFWGLDQDVDPKESTVLSERSAALANSTLIGSREERCSLHPAQTQTSTLNQHYCRDCDPHSVRKEALTSHYPSSRYTASSSFSAGAGGAGRSAAGDPGPSTIYCRDKSRRSKTGVLQSLLDSFLPCGRRAAASVWFLLTQVFQAGLTLTTQLPLLSWNNKAKTEADTGSGKVVNGAHSSYCGVMNLKEAGANEKLLGLNGSLWKAMGDMVRWLGRRWHHLVGYMSLFRGFLLTRFLPNLLRLLLVLLPLLLLLSLCWWGPAGLLSVLPAVNMTDWRTALPVSSLPSLSSVYPFTSAQSRPAEKPAEESGEVQSYVEPPFTPLLQADTPLGDEDEAVSPADSARLLQLERSLSGLWERVEAGGRRADQRHGEVLQTYRDLRQRLLPPRGPGDDAEPWLTGLLEHGLNRLRGQLDRERLHREQTQQQYLEQQQSQAARLAQLELLLQELAAKTEEVHQRQEAAATVTSSATTLPAPVSAGVDRESHDALLAEVVRLEAALGSVRQDLQGLTGCRDRCERLDGVQETISAQVSAQVREELRSLFYGNQLTTGGEASGDPAAVPDSLLRWLSERYVSGADLHAALASLELGILRNVSRQLERRGGEKTSCTETVEQTVAHAAGAAGAAMTQEEIHQIVKNALRLFSQDRTGLADYALESGGGSILSTRCSETYETKTALMSLFGVPLWYFSQSPRAVIQPDVHPGSCWAFRGSTGYLVIRLSMRILPTAFSLEHIPKALAPSGTLRSAPRDFTVYGLDDESQDNGKLLGSYTYEEDGEALQTYTVSEENDRAFQIVEVQVLSNWGHEQYTCVYRFRVHGKPRDD